MRIRNLINGYFEDETAFDMIEKIALMLAILSAISALLCGGVLSFAGMSPQYIGKFEGVFMFTVVGGIVLFVILFGITLGLLMLGHFVSRYF